MIRLLTVKQGGRIRGYGHGVVILASGCSHILGHQCDTVEVPHLMGFDIFDGENNGGSMRLRMLDSG